MELIAFAFNSSCSFLFTRCKFNILGREYVIYPGTVEYCDVIQTIIDNSERDEVFRDVNKFLIGFGWTNNCAFKFAGSAGMGITGEIDLFNKAPILYVYRTERNLFVDFTRIIIPTNAYSEIGLSLYNDAISSNDYFHRFLCLWKILEIPYPGRKLDATSWINDVIKNKSNIIDIDNSIKELISEGVNVGKYYKNECRHAIAHIERKPTVISYNLNDYEKIRSACHTIETFVRYFIRNELDLPIYNQKINIIDKS